MVVRIKNRGTWFVGRGSLIVHQPQSEDDQDRWSGRMRTLARPGSMLTSAPSSSSACRLAIAEITCAPKLAGRISCACTWMTLGVRACVAAIKAPKSRSLFVDRCSLSVARCSWVSTQAGDRFMSISILITRPGRVRLPRPAKRHIVAPAEYLRVRGKDRQ